jgi:hypothetical protein
MKSIKQISFSMAAFFLISLSIINGCGDKGGGVTPPPPNPCSGVTITVSGTVTNTTTGQSVGAINASASGSSSFTFSLNSGAFQASGNFAGLAAGTYTVTAKNADGCTGVNTFTVNDPCTVKNITISATVINTILGTANGSIAATGSGSTGFTYSINGGAFQASGTFAGLAIGAYTIVAKDFEGCLKSQVFNVQDICAAKAITVTGTVVNHGPVAGTANGSIAASATGIGSTSFTYQLNAGAFQGSGTFTGLTAGAYTVTAKDQDGCLKPQPFTVIFDPCIGKTLTISATIIGNDKCSPTPTGRITITAGGGVGFMYSLNGGAFQASNIFNNLAAAAYTIAARDADGCIKTGNATVTDAPAGTTFSAVKAVLQLNCAISGCHVAPSPTGGLNFTLDCTIVGAWDRIKARAVDAIPSIMPPPPNAPLSAADRQKILDWITAGHRFID